MYGIFRRYVNQCPLTYVHNRMPHAAGCSPGNDPVQVGRRVTYGLTCSAHARVGLRWGLATATVADMLLQHAELLADPRADVVHNAIAMLQSFLLLLCVVVKLPNANSVRGKSRKEVLMLALLMAVAAYPSPLYFGG
jgi:hypothetical protein